jgi:hypothetical protein
MRNGQNKRMRGRNRKSHNPLTRVYESNGPDVKIRGTASHVAEKYIQLARDAQASGDPVGAENYYQHAEHYFRMIAAAQEQLRQNQPFYGNRPDPNGGGGNDMRDGSFDDEGDDEAIEPQMGEEAPAFGTRDPQPTLPRDAQFYSPQGGEQNRRPQHNPNASHNDFDDVDRLPSFITGGQPPNPLAPNGQSGGYENGGGEQQRFHGERNGERNERYGGFRRRRRHRGGGGHRGDAQSGHESGDDSSQG